MFFSLLYVFIVILNLTFLRDDSGCKDKSFFLINKELAFFLRSERSGGEITITFFPLRAYREDKSNGLDACVCVFLLIISGLCIVERCS